MNLPLYTIWYIGTNNMLYHESADTTAAALAWKCKLEEKGYLDVEIWLTRSMRDVTKEIRPGW